MTMTNSDPEHLRQKRLALAEPDAGWSRDVYDRELGAYAAARGRPPQTVTMHPDTAHVLGLSTEFAPPTADHARPLVITSSDYAPQTITLYY